MSDQSVDTAIGNTQVEAAAATWSIDGRFDAHETAAFRERFDAFVDEGGLWLHIVMKQTSFVDSSGLAELVRSMKRLRTLGGDVTLVDPSPPTTVILELTRLNTAFTIVREAAV